MSRQPPPPAAIAIGLATAVPGLFGFFCPGVMDAADKDPVLLKRQQAKAGAAALMLGAAGSWSCAAPWPFLLSVALVALIMWEYNTTGTRKAAD